MSDATVLSHVAYRLHRHLTNVPITETTLEELADELRTSRNKVRQALLELEEKGLASIGEAL